MPEGLSRVPATDPQVEVTAGELHRLGLDPARGEGLQGELAGVDVPATVVTDVQDRTVLGQQADQPHELVDERVGVLDREREDPEMTVDAGGGRDGPRPEHPRQSRRRFLAGRDGLYLDVGAHPLPPCLSHRGGEQRHLGPGGLVGVQVQPERGCGGAHLVGITAERRRVGCHVPVVSKGLNAAVVGQVGDDRPVLVRGQMDDQRPDGQGLQPAGMLGRRIAAGEPRRVDVHGAVDRDAVPVRHLDPDAERGRREPLGHMGHHVVTLPVLGVLLELERQNATIPLYGLGSR